jgi:nitrogen fixation protein NifU and related proteins
MTSLLYPPKVFAHFRNPKNMGEIKHPDSVALVGNPRCGDVMKMYLKVSERKKNNKKEFFIKDIKFQTLGCAAAIATSSVITILAKGKSLAQAEKISKDDVARKLGGLPKIKLHCSVLSVEGLKKAIKNFKKKRKKKND